MCVAAAAKEVADPVRCRFLVMKSAENKLEAKYPTETDVDYSDDACELIIAVNEVRRSNPCLAWSLARKMSPKQRR